MYSNFSLSELFFIFCKLLHTISYDFANLGCAILGQDHTGPCFSFYLDVECSLCIFRKHLRESNLSLPGILYSLECFPIGPLALPSVIWIFLHLKLYIVLDIISFLYIELYLFER